MKQWNKLQELKQEYDAIQPPEHGVQEVLATMEKAKRLQKKKQTVKRARWITGVAAALAVIIAVPNVSPTAAAYLNDVPVISSVVRVVTLDRYRFSRGNYQAEVATPKVDSSSSAAKKVNQEVKQYTRQLIKQFKQDMKLDEKGFKALDVRYETVTNTDQWFTLKIDVLETQASGYQRAKFYNIDKRTGKVVALKDLFRNGSNYVTVLSDNIKSQMRGRMKKDPNQTYFLDSDTPDTDFHKIKADQSFYRNKEGKLVIAFDEYEVAPGCMGTQEFVIDNSVISSILK